MNFFKNDASVTILHLNGDLMCVIMIQLLNLMKCAGPRPSTHTTHTTDAFTSFHEYTYQCNHYQCTFKFLPFQMQTAPARETTPSYESCFSLEVYLSAVKAHIWIWIMLLTWSLPVGCESSHPVEVRPTNWWRGSVDTLTPFFDSLLPMTSLSNISQPNFDNF